MKNPSSQNIFTSADMVRLLLRYAEFTGIDMEMLERKVDIDRFRLQRRLPLAVFQQIWDSIQKEACDPDFGLHLGEVFVRFAEGHILFSVMRNCPTMETALEKFFRYHSLMADILRPRMAYRKSEVILLLERVFPGLPIRRHHVEATLAMLASTLKQLSDNCIVPMAVDFQHPRPARTEEHTRIFSAPLRFGQNRDALMVSTIDLARPILMANPDFLDAHEKLAQRLMRRINRPESVADKTRGAIQGIITRGDPARLDAVARQLAFSKRSLQERLAKDGTSFRQLLNEARRNLAGTYLKEPDTSICDVAFLLGFSDQSAFNHAFKRWYGVSPRRYLQKNTPC